MNMHVIQDCNKCVHSNVIPEESPCRYCVGDHFEPKDVVPEKTDEPLLAALKLIRDECNKHEYCNECPLRLCENNCYLLREKSVRPGKWKFKGEEEEEPVRLFL